MANATLVKQYEDYIKDTGYRITPTFKDKSCTVVAKATAAYHAEARMVQYPEFSFSSTGSPNSATLYEQALAKVVEAMKQYRLVRGGNF